MSIDPQQVHDDAIIIDALFCQLDLPIPATEQAPDLMLAHLRHSGVTAFCDSLIADVHPMTIEEALLLLHDQSIAFNVFPEHFVHVRTVDDLYAAKRTGRIGRIFSTQGLRCIGEETRYIWVLHALGVRVMQLVYNEHNALGSGCMEPNDYGLTRSGQKAIEEMNRLGVVLDLSHVGTRTSLEAIAHTKQPAIFSHSSVRALGNHRRNVTDDQIKAVADKGGVVGLCPHSVFIERERGKRPTVHDFIDHIEYVAELVGVDHVGIGTDNFQYETFQTQLVRAGFEQTLPGFFGGYPPEEKHAAGFGQWSDWPNLTQSLLARGFSPDDTKKILGGNFLRVFQQVWR